MVNEKKKKKGFEKSTRGNKATKESNLFNIFFYLFSREISTFFIYIYIRFVTIIVIHCFIPLFRTN